MGFSEVLNTNIVSSLYRNPIFVRLRGVVLSTDYDYKLYFACHPRFLPEIGIFPGFFPVYLPYLNRSGVTVRNKYDVRDQHPK
ncbi:hypothetical protein Y032_0030g2071 [Ancylostoma ceylanicum]|nr:hypothetical protein Y032_0030g2071 [Ancylostoma ceylanicum]